MSSLCIPFPSPQACYGVSDDVHLTIVQCHLYHQPPSSDLYRTSIGILRLLRYHQQIYILIIAITNQHHALLYRSTTRAPPCSTHVPCCRPIILCMHQFSRSWVLVTTRTCKDLSQHPLASFRVRVFSLYVSSYNHMLSLISPYMLMTLSV